MKINILNDIKLSKTLEFKSLGKKEPILLEKGKEYEVSEKWREKFANFTDFIEIIEEVEVVTPEEVEEVNQGE